MDGKQTIQTYQAFGIEAAALRFADDVLSDLAARFSVIDDIAEQNQLKVIRAMQACKVSEACLSGTSGYGYNDLGRDTLEEVYAKVFGTEAALVRSQISCGTHALAIALFGNLRPGDELLSITGAPYDTLEEVIGIRPADGSLAEYGISYAQVDLQPDGAFDLPGILSAIHEQTKMIAIQRSKGYARRKSISIQAMADVIAAIKEKHPHILIMVDNCYGEFVCAEEPSDVGADLVVGSLIKNPGGGLAPVGGYLCGTNEAIQKAAARMTSPGLLAEVGPSLQVNPLFYQGLFFAPTVVASAVKAALFASLAYERLGFAVFPPAGDERTDIITALSLPSAEALKAFCRGIQKAAAVDSHVTPEAAPMPGYADEVIMAAGSFIAGSSIELSADGPLRAPYTAYFQGGLTWPSAKLGILLSMQTLKDEGFLSWPKEMEDA